MMSSLQSFLINIIKLMESDLYGTPQNSGPGPRYAIFFSEKTLRKSALWLRKVPSTVFSIALREKWTYPQFYGLYSVNRLMIRATLCLSSYSIVSTPSFFSKSSLFVWFSPTHPLFPPEFWAKWRKLHKDLQAWSGWNILLCSGDQVPRMYLHGSSRIHHEFTHSIGEKEQFFISFKISCWPTLTL